MKTPTLILAALLISGPAGAQDLRAEISDEVIDRCYEAAAHFRLWQARSGGYLVPLTAASIVAELKRAEHTEGRSSKSSSRRSKARIARPGGGSTTSRFVECFLSSAGE